MLMQTFRGQIRCIMGGVQVAYWGKEKEAIPFLGLLRLLFGRRPNRVIEFACFYSKLQ